MTKEVKIVTPNAIELIPNIEVKAKKQKLGRVLDPNYSPTMLTIPIN